MTPCLLMLPALLGTASAALRAQDPDELIERLRREVAVLSDQLVEERARLLLDIRVNGQKLDRLEVMREVVYLAGSKLVEAKVTESLVLHEMRKQIDQGLRRPEEFLVSDEDVAATAPVSGSESGLDRDARLALRKQTLLFDRVFLPGSPREWPDITREAIMAKTSDGQGQQFLEQLDQAGRPDPDGKPRPLPEFWIKMMRQFVLQALRNRSEIRYASHGLPSSVALRVNGTDWATEDAFALIEADVSVQQLERARQELAIREALRQDLVDKGVYVSDSEFLARYAAYRPLSYPWPINFAVIRSPFVGYPCMETVRARWRLLTSYTDLIRDEIGDATLQAHAYRYGALFADGQCSIDLIPFPARDPKAGAGRHDGMKQAKARADAVFAMLETRELEFDEALLQQSEGSIDNEKRGRLGFVRFDQLEQVLRESEYNHLLNGHSVSRYLFFDADVGKVHGPVAGPDGYFIVRINSRRPARRTVDIVDEYECELVRQDYIRCRFLEWANEVIDRSTFK